MTSLAAILSMCYRQSALRLTLYTLNARLMIESRESGDHSPLPTCCAALS